MESNGRIFRVHSRSLAGSDTSTHEGSDPASAFAAALSHKPNFESILFWDDARYISAVDIDGCAFNDAKLLLFIENFQPQPAYTWVTHGSGVRLIYFALYPYTAEEIAAIAALNAIDNITCTNVELKKDTRHPYTLSKDGHKCGEVIQRVQEFDVRSLRKRLKVYAITDAEVKAWMDARGFDIGGRYDHTNCPVSPSARGGRQPVVLLEDGVFCFICAADGICAGSSKPGFFPFAYLCGETNVSSIYRVFEHGTHWEQAKFLFEERRDLAKLLYTAGVTMFRCREDATRGLIAGKDFIRIGDRWTNLSGEPYSRDVSPILSTLPACTFRDDKGRIKVNRSHITLMSQAFDLSSYGYTSLVPVFGCRMWPNQMRNSAVIQVRELAIDSAAELRPRYISVGRMSEEDMWAEFEACCPNLNRSLLMLLIAARGVVEGEASRPPMVFITGPTGASKTLSAFLAASVCGDHNTEIVWTPNSDRVRQAMMDAATSGTFVTFNEVLKEARRQIKDKRLAMDYVLNLTPDSTSHYMYIGPMKMGRLPVIIWTDTELPDALKKDAQLANRLVHVHLPNAVNWESSLRDSGVDHPKRFRISSERRARAADALLSIVIDRFCKPMKQFKDIAVELGFAKMIDSTEAEEGRNSLRELFNATCNAAPISGSDAIRWKGRGWKLIDRDVETPLRDAWLAVVDEDSFCESRAASEIDWQALMMLSESAKIEIRAHGLRLAIRFRSVDGTRSTYRVNEELK